MKIKIGNFNFIDKTENKLNLGSDLRVNYFYLDGKENTLYVNNTWGFDFAKENPNDENYNFERDLMKEKHIYEYGLEIKNMINTFLNNKAEKIFNDGDYSRYDLYKDVGIYTISHLKENSKFQYNYNNSEEIIDFDNNKIYKGEIIFNPYTQNIENLEYLYQEGYFKNIMKNLLISKEIENHSAPLFIERLTEINKFLDGKKQVTVEATGLKPFKTDATLGSIIDLRNNKIIIECYGTDYRKQNPGATRETEINAELAGLRYGKDVMQFAQGTFKNLEDQIAITPEDKWLFKLDELSKKHDDEYRNFIYKCEVDKNKVGVFCHIPYTIKEALQETVRAEIGQQDIPQWYLDNKEDFDNFFEKYEALEKLKTFETIGEFEEGIDAFRNDEEFMKIAKEFRDTFDYDMGGYVYPVDETEESEEEER